MTLSAWPALSQHPIQPNQPVVEEPKPKPVTSPAKSKDEEPANTGKPQQPTPASPAAVGQSVNAPAAAVKPENGDEDAGNELAEIAQRDLAAQNAMAEGTWQMARAAWIGVALTAIGVLLLWRTLIHTRGAAVSAGAMVAEAKSATAAAIAATNEAKRQADIAEGAAKESLDSVRRLERPYLFLEVTDATRLRMVLNNRPFVLYNLVNHGRTPAILRSITVGLFYDPKQLPPRLPTALKETFYAVIEPTGTLRDDRRVDLTDDGDITQFVDTDATRLILRALIFYEDTTGAMHSDTITLRANPGGLSFRIEEMRRRTRYPGDPYHPDDAD